MVNTQSKAILIFSGISDIVTAIKAAAGEAFSWASWAVGKVVQYVVALVGYGLSMLAKVIPALTKVNEFLGFADHVQTDALQIIKEVSINTFKAEALSKL